MAKAGVAHARAHLRQLCCLGLDSEIIMPDVLKALHGVIEHHSSIFVWFDEHGQPCNLYSDIFVPDIINLYFNEYQNLQSPDAPDLVHIAQRGKLAGNYRQMSKAFYATDMYNMICRPCEQHFLLDGVIRSDGRTLGVIVLYREKSQGAFSGGDEADLKALLPYFEHALNQEQKQDTLEFSDSGMTGMIVATPDGHISHINADAREMLFWASQGVLRPGSCVVDPTESLPSQVKRLCDRLRDVFCSRDSPPPVLQVRGRYGQVTSRAYWMDDVRGLDEKLVAITLTWQKPKQLVLMNRLRQLPLSAKQKEVCLLLGMGRSAQETALQLGISNTTYKDHLRKIYQKLDINRRDELLLRLR